MNRKAIFAFMLLVLFTTISNAFVTTNYDNREKENKMRENTISGNSWEFYSTIKPPTTEELKNEDNYKFGEEAGCLYNMFLYYYIVKEEIVSGDPNRRTVIRKPAIYNAVRSIEKQLNKELKNNAITKEEAAGKFASVLRVAISAIDSDSQSFENTLYTNRKNPEVLLSLFDKVRLIEI
ncbi:MAG: hypothetical protein LBV74_09310 [Tannerella sp.]|jgi:hypothetical protein|nr:hypothetical protein [Tannerella sp.]